MRSARRAPRLRATRARRNTRSAPRRRQTCGSNGRRGVRHRRHSSGTCGPAAPLPRGRRGRSQPTPSSPAMASGRLVAARNARGGVGCKGGGGIPLPPPCRVLPLRGYKRAPASSRPAATNALRRKPSPCRDPLSPTVTAAEPARVALPCDPLDHCERPVAFPGADAGRACSAFPPPLATARAPAGARSPAAEVLCLGARHGTARTPAKPAGKPLERLCALDHRELPEHLARDDRGEVQCSRHHAASHRAR